MSDEVGFENNLVEYVVVNVGLITKTRRFIIDCEYFKTQENQRFSASEVL